MSYIAESLHQGFLNLLSSSTGSELFSFLIDGTTDAGNQEDQLIVLVYTDKNEVTSESLLVHVIFQSILLLMLVSCIKDALKQVGIR